MVDLTFGEFSRLRSSSLILPTLRGFPAQAGYVSSLLLLLLDVAGQEDLDAQDDPDENKTANEKAKE